MGQATPLGKSLINGHAAHRTHRAKLRLQGRSIQVDRSPRITFQLFIMNLFGRVKLSDLTFKDSHFLEEAFPFLPMGR